MKNISLKQTCLEISKSVAVFAVTAFILCLFLILTAMIPNQAIQKNIAVSDM